MAKKSTRKSARPLPHDSGTKPSDRAYPAEPDELEDQQQRLKKAAAMGAQALKLPAPATTPDLRPAPAPTPSPPLTTLAAVWPTSASAQPASQSVQPVAQPTKIPVQWQPTPAPGKAAAAVAEAPLPTASPKIKVSFVLLDLGAEQVSLSGDFNGWSPDATPMKRTEDGHWETTVELAPGRYQYKFVVDGKWIPDPLAHKNVWNQHGTLNSILEIRA